MRVKADSQLPSPQSAVHSPATLDSGLWTLDCFVSFSFFAAIRLHAFAEPLLDHALIIQIPRPGEPADPREHPRSIRNVMGHRLGGFRTARPWPLPSAASPAGSPPKIPPRPLRCRRSAPLPNWQKFALKTLPARPRPPRAPTCRGLHGPRPRPRFIIPDYENEDDDEDDFTRHPPPVTTHLSP